MGTSHKKVDDVVIASAGTKSDVINIEGYSSGTIQIPATITSTELTFNVSARNNAATGDMQAAKTADGTAAYAAVSIAANDVITIPAHIMANRWIEFEVDSAEGAERTFAFYRETPAT